MGSFEIIGSSPVFFMVSSDFNFSEYEVGCLHRFFAAFSKRFSFLKNCLTNPTNSTSDKPITFRNSPIMSAPATKFKVADLSLAAFGRKEIELAEVCLTTPGCLLEINTKLLE